MYYAKQTAAPNIRVYKIRHYNHNHKTDVNTNITRFTIFVLTF